MLHLVHGRVTFEVILFFLVLQAGTAYGVEEHCVFTCHWCKKQRLLHSKAEHQLEYAAGAECRDLTYSNGCTMQLTCRHSEKVGLRPPNPRDGLHTEIVGALSSYADAELLCPGDEEVELLELYPGIYVASMLYWKQGLRPEGVEVDNFFTSDKYTDWCQ